MKKAFRLLSLISLLHAPLALAFQPFSSFHFFGDSLSDMGNQPGKRSNGAYWGEQLAARYGKTVKPSSQGGTNWANSGARTYDKDVNGITHQVNDALAAGPIDKRGLYSVWVGANDLTRYFEKDSPEIIFNEGKNNTVAALRRLHNAGARYIMVMNVPDLSKTPAFDGQSEENKAGFALLVNLYNAHVREKINNIGFKVIQVDVNSTFNAVIANPTRYGFTNVIEQYIKCDKTKSKCDVNEYLFYDDRHPTEAGHQLLADIVSADFQGAANAAVIADAPLAAMSEANTALSNELLAVRNNAVKFQQGERYRAFVSGAIAPTVYSRDEVNLANYRQTDYALTVGMDYRWAKHVLVGAALSHIYSRVNFGGAGGSFKMDDNLLSVFASYYRKRWYVNGIASFGLVDYRNINRNIRLYQALDVATARARATHLGGQIELGYNVFSSTVKSGPFATLTYQTVNVDTFSESGATAGRNLVYYRMLNDSFVTGLGWQIAATTLWHNKKLMPYAQVSYNKEWLRKNDVVDGIREIDVANVTMSGAHSNIPVGPQETKGWMLLNLGVNAQLSNSLYGSLSVQSTLLRKPYASYAVMAGLQVPF